MSAIEKQLNPTDLTRQDLDRIVFAVQGHAKTFFVVEKPLDRESAAAYVGIAVSTFDKLTRAGTFPKHKVPGLDIPLFLPSELLEVIKRS